MCNAFTIGAIGILIITGLSVFYAIRWLKKTDFYAGSVASALVIVAGFMGHIATASLEFKVAGQILGLNVDVKRSDPSINITFAGLVILIMMLFASLTMLLRHKESLHAAERLQETRRDATY
jgi:hypothetical protein